MSGTSDFLYPRGSYRGQFNPQHLVFNANLQEFAQRVGYISSLETNGKLSPEESYKQVKALWKQLKKSKKSLGIGQLPPLMDDEAS
ncbi:hypothetical protein IQ266_19165 [filamentous cyanobacterium LEGE 11480]|uniref:Isopropylmalate/homocitrate/citramalate synthases n=1 Tax=Romeriopsis navalis LEGE 11480 TaxID=2777977 RepID=A0A928VNI8_9CYAN|nr:hypothetical protein [Romeriopsis navalis]MBE9031858.1 hypothetical protein [Romeriopsis navalis LEGE 11480]